MSVKIGICLWSLPVTSPEGIALAGELGYEGVEMDMGFTAPERDLRNEEVLQSYIAAGEKAGIVFPTVALNGISLTSPDSRAMIDQALAAAVKLGCKRLQMPSFGQDAMEDGERLEKSIESLRYACEKAEELDIDVASENTLLAAENAQLVLRMAKSNFSVYFDGPNLVHLRNADPVAQIKAMLPLVKEAHVKDSDLSNIKESGWPAAAPLGKGDCKAMETMQVLREGEFSGWLFVENTLPAQDLKADAETVKAVFAK